MSEDQIKAGLGSLDPKHAFIVALEALVADDIESETAGVVAPELTDAARQFNSGRLAHARDFKNVIQGAIKDAQTARTEDVERARKRAES
jgi:hypothetical protein